MKFDIKRIEDSVKIINQNEKDLILQFFTDLINTKMSFSGKIKIYYSGCQSVTQQEDIYVVKFGKSNETIRFVGKNNGLQIDWNPLDLKFMGMITNPKSLKFIFSQPRGSLTISSDDLVSYFKTYFQE